MKVKGNVFRFEHNIDTDIIIPARYCSSYQKEDLTPHCMEGHPEWTDGSFAKQVKDGDIIVAFPKFIEEIIKSGGLINWIKEQGLT